MKQLRLLCCAGLVCLFLGGVSGVSAQRAATPEEADNLQSLARLRLLADKLNSGEYILCPVVVRAGGETNRVQLPMRLESCIERINKQLAAGTMTPNEAAESFDATASANRQAQANFATALHVYEQQIHAGPNQPATPPTGPYRPPIPEPKIGDNQTTVVTTVTGGGPPTPDGRATRNGNGCGLGVLWEVTETTDAASRQVTWLQRSEGSMFEVAGEKASVKSKVYIILDGNTVTVARTNSGDGSRCTYDGELQADGVTVKGTYRCAEMPARVTYRWSAVIRCP